MSGINNQEEEEERNERVRITQQDGTEDIKYLSSDFFDLLMRTIKYHLTNYSQVSKYNVVAPFP